MRPLSLSEVIQLHEYLLEQSGGITGIRDLGALESAVAQPHMTFRGVDLYQTIQEKAGKRIRLLYCMVLLCAILALLHGCILKDDRLADVQSKLDQNQRKWTSAMVSNYQFNFQWICYCSPEYVDPVNISVRENRIDDAVFVEDEVPVAVEGLERYRTIEGLFDLLQEGIDENAHTISAHYHSELGYPVKASIDYEEDSVDEELGFEIDSLSIE